MKTGFFVLLLFLNLPALAQTVAYQPFEVDSAADAHGGVAFLNTFIQTNLRKPIQAEAKGIGGRVIVGGVVEPDGRISNVKVLQGFRPDCDREAIRVFSLFNAWKPAKKNGQAVRQQVSIPIFFKPNTPFTYIGGAKVNYYGADRKIITDSSLARYKQIAPIDTNGLPTGDIVVYEAKKTSWKEDFRLPFVRQKSGTQIVSNKPLYSIGNQNSRQQWEGNVFVMDEAGALTYTAYYKDGQPVSPFLTYHPNGSIAQKRDESEDRFAIMTWYMNGQVKEIKSMSKPKPYVIGTPEQVTAFWDSTGHQEVNNGNGRAIYEAKTRSRSDTTRQTQFIEQGFYKDGFKQGIWTGRYSDGSYFYEEQYDKGICQTGKARSVGSDTVRYSVVEKQPEFIGGMQALGQFLAQNLRYPVDAQRAKVQGKVFVSFVINTDGRVDDVQVLKGVGFGADEEAARVVKATNGHWKPGFQRGQSVKVKYNLPINFTLQ